MESVNADIFTIDGIANSLNVIKIQTIHHYVTGGAANVFNTIDIDDENNSIHLNIDKVSHSTSYQLKNISDAELRRCFKLVFELDGDLRQIAERTIQFVRLDKCNDPNYLYNIRTVEPFWNRPEWLQMWNERLYMHHHASIFAPPQSIWKQGLMQCVDNYNISRINHAAMYR